MDRNLDAKLKWGIISTGGIAETFVKDLAFSKRGTAYAVGSRSLESAKAFAGRLNIPHAYATYEELVNDPKVDAVYIGTPHPFHKENALLALRAGKAVLCEKPFTLNAGELEEVVAAARESGRFLMEAMWTRFIPAIVQTRQWIAEGMIGDPRLVKADLGFRAGWDPEGRLLNRSLGGGALLDVGIYTVSFASMIFGPEPEEVFSTVKIGETGVDEHYSVLLSYGDGRTASLNGGIRLNMENAAAIYGTEGRIELPASFNDTRSAVLYRNGEEPVTFTDDRKAAGYAFEADEVARCLEEGLTESPVMTLDESLGIMRLLDRIRKPWGLVYPGE